MILKNLTAPVFIVIDLSINKITINSSYIYCKIIVLKLDI